MYTHVLKFLNRDPLVKENNEAQNYIVCLHYTLCQIILPCQAQKARLKLIILYIEHS